MELQGKNILLVEDDEFIGDIILQHLKNAGATYAWARNGNEGLTKLHEGTFDLILTDLMMGEMNGVEMIKNIRDDEKYTHIPILVLTNLTNDDTEVKQAGEFNVSGFFSKSSTSLGELVVRIAKILEN